MHTLSRMYGFGYRFFPLAPPLAGALFTAVMRPEKWEVVESQRFLEERR